MSTPVDYASWATLAKAQAVEQRMDDLTAGMRNSWVLVTSWSNGWGVYAGRNLGVKMIDQGTAVRISGQIQAGTLTNGTVCFWVGAPFQPGRNEVIVLGTDGWSATGACAPYIEIGSNGNAVIQGAGNFVGGHWVIQGVYPLDTF
jgi:hypothetical protein